MARLKLGQADYLNCLPIYYALEEGQLPLEVDLIKGPQKKLNEMFLSKELDIAPISSIEYAKVAGQCYILPDISVSTNGQVGSVLLFSKVPVTELEKKRVALSAEAATSEALLKILLDHYYHVEVEYLTSEQNLDEIFNLADAVLLVGDKAMLFNQQVIKQKLPYIVTDLGAAWNEFTGEKTVFTIWAVHRKLVEKNREKIIQIAEGLHRSKLLGLQQMSTLLDISRRKSGLSLSLLEEYFKHFYYDFDDSHYHALITFFDYAYKSGIIGERVQLNIWEEKQGK